MSKYSIDIIRKVFNDNSGASIQVSSEDDVLVRIRTTDKESISYYGNFDFSLPPECVLKLAQAMKECAEELLKEDVKI